MKSPKTSEKRGAISLPGRSRGGSSGGSRPPGAIPPPKTHGSVSPRLLLAIALVLLPLVLLAQAPTWWYQDYTGQEYSGGHAPVSTTGTNDYAAVNQGQLKNLATAAVAHLDASLPEPGAGDALHTLVYGWTNPTPQTNDYAAVNLGQLKNVAKPFYDRLLDVGYQGHPLESGTYPWIGGMPNDYAMANIGQVKNLFSFDIADITNSPSPLLQVSSDENGTTLTWTYGAGNQTGFKIERWTQADGWKTVTDGTVGANVRSFFDPASGGQRSMAMRSPGENLATAQASGVAFAVYTVTAINLIASSPSSAQVSSDGTDPTVTDSDGDGLTDAYEMEIGTDPKLGDSDSDTGDPKNPDDGLDGCPLDPDLHPPRLPETQYAVIDLTALGFNDPKAINDSFQILDRDDESPWHARVWLPDTFEFAEVSLPNSTFNAWNTSLSSAGKICNRSSVWSPGGDVVPLGVPMKDGTARGATANSVSSSGTVLGSIDIHVSGQSNEPVDIINSSYHCGVSWTSESPTFVGDFITETMITNSGVLLPHGYNCSGGTAVSPQDERDGIIVGSGAKYKYLADADSRADNSNIIDMPVVVENGTTSILPDPKSATPSNGCVYSINHCVNSASLLQPWAVGWYGVGSPALWFKKGANWKAKNIGAHSTTDNSDVLYGRAWKINDRCEIIGSFGLWQNGRIVDLNKRVAGYTNVYPYDINNTGAMLAAATRSADSKTVPVLLLPIEFRNLSETNNKANKIWNPTKKDDPAADGVPINSAGEIDGVPRNKLYLVTDPADGKYKASLDVGVPLGLRSKFIAAAYVGETKVADSDTPFSGNDEPVDIEFTHPSSSGDIADFSIRIGYDANGNGELDSGEQFKLTVFTSSEKKTKGEITVRGANGAQYNWALTVTNQIISGALIDWATNYYLPHAKRFLQIFRDGGYSTVPVDKQPTSQDPFATLDAFNGYFDEWLTHNSGAQFSEQGVATITEYQWNTNTSAANLVATSPQIQTVARDFYHTVVETQAAAYFLNLPVGSPPAYFPSDTGWYDVPHAALHEGPSWVKNFGVTVTFDTWLPNAGDDVNGTIGRGRILSHQARYRVEKRSVNVGPPDAPYYEDRLVVTEMVSKGEVIDLYDFNFESAGSTGAAQDAAILQIGFGNGHYGSDRNRGKIYRDRIQFNKTYTSLP